MKTAYYIGMDIAKLNFQVYGEDKNGNQCYNRKLIRKNVLAFFSNIPKCVVGIEACGGAHYWAREIAKIGHTVNS